ncbi:MAG: hypothetical protein ACLQU1_35625 [Bryobacteraceae bacterium]
MRPWLTLLFSTEAPRNRDIYVPNGFVTEETTQAPPDWVGMGAWVERQQAFAVIASQCSAAQALP